MIYCALLLRIHLIMDSQLISCLTTVVKIEEKVLKKMFRQNFNCSLQKSSCVPCMFSGKWMNTNLSVQEIWFFNWEIKVPHIIVPIRSCRMGYSKHRLEWILQLLYRLTDTQLYSRVKNPFGLGSNLNVFVIFYLFCYFWRSSIHFFLVEITFEVCAAITFKFIVFSSLPFLHFIYLYYSFIKVYLFITSILLVEVTFQVTYVGSEAIALK